MKVNKKWKLLAWSLFAVLVVVLLFIARKQQEEQVAASPTIAISVVDENAFLTENELLLRLKRNNLVYQGQQMQQLNTTAIEAYIRKMHEVELVDVYKRLGGQWNIRVKVRQPYARIFNKHGQSFYVDAKGATMDPSPNFTARVLVFSGNISDKSDSLTVEEILKDPDLAYRRSIDEIYRIAKYIAHDDFLRAQITQVHRDRWGDFVFIPQVGGHEIMFGSANSDQEVKEKMEKLKIFYKEGLPYEGWNKYELINLKYKNQIVCRKREKSE
jgi:cell division protein FtsQ